MSERTLVVGGYGYGNVGDEAMLAGLLTQLDPEQVTVVSRDPRRTTVTHGVRSIPIHLAPIALATHRSVLIGGGSLFGRDMGRLGRLLPAFGVMASRLGKRVELVGIGLDDVSPTNRSVRRLLRLAARVVVRDGRSLEVARRWGVNATLEPDLSSAMPGADPNVGRELLRSSGVDMRRPVVGLCLTAVDEGLARNVVESLSAAIDRLAEVEFVFVPMARHPSVPAHDDGVLGRRLADARPRVHLLEQSDDPAAILSAFEWFDAAACMRFHSLVFAERSGVPIVPISYASKCSVWLGERGMTSIEPTVEALSDAISRVLPAERRAG
jgi:polysaccharide pyruvyl transferase WcaK-like protein